MRLFNTVDSTAKKAVGDFCPADIVWRNPLFRDFSVNNPERRIKKVKLIIVWRLGNLKTKTILAVHDLADEIVGL